MASEEKKLENQLLKVGNKLLKPPSSTNGLLYLLNRVKSLLERVEQSPTKSLQDALSPSLKALIGDALLRHADIEVKVTVASCVIDIVRISAPEIPYDDDQMKEVFRLITSSFENLHDKLSKSYTKRTFILNVVSKFRVSMIMLDLECDDLILEMFQHFLKEIRYHHPMSVFSDMKSIMVHTFEESNDSFPTNLLSPILASVKKNNEEVLPIARRLAESVLESCATILRPYLKQVVNTLGISLDDYSDVLVSICQEKIGSLKQNDEFLTNDHMEDEIESRKELVEESTQDKPISLKLLEASKSSNLTIEKEPKKLIDFREGTKDMDKMSNTKAYGAKLVGTRVKVWWPDDKMFYEGVVSYFYAPRNMHKGEGTYCTCHDALKDLSPKKRKRTNSNGGASSCKSKRVSKKSDNSDDGSATSRSK
ncbi:hypothetical protein GLYMA_13G081350v4 [Glycine max]|nr:hypothetical protein GLYMA_13G081350v4 [Glycine max]KAH1100374.1 hypothetical protein GYH30_035508 [Glycine max]